MIRKKIYMKMLSAFLMMLIFTAACGRTGGTDQARTDKGGKAGLSSETVMSTESDPETETGTGTETENKRY